MSTANVFQQLFAYTGPSLAGNPERMAQFLFVFLAIIFAVNVIVSLVCGRLLTIVLNVLLGWALLSQVLGLINSRLSSLIPYPISNFSNLNGVQHEFLRALDSLSKF